MERIRRREARGGEELANECKEDSRGEGELRDSGERRGAQGQGRIGNGEEYLAPERERERTHEGGGSAGREVGYVTFHRVWSEDSKDWRKAA